MSRNSVGDRSYLTGRVDQLPGREPIAPTAAENCTLRPPSRRQSYLGKAEALYHLLQDAHSVCTRFSSLVRPPKRCKCELQAKS